ncbi:MULTISPECIES: GHMP kinase [Acetomicrobium]|jgi:D-glycero-alpha-D-manno-heptose-7-phosphate kinase|uniref:GHMP family kinase ATP-binding protein n=1 Tax=Acetomicrobium TaxID=49894 RepID=UPI0026EF3D7C|nr:GHMP kinase [Acetomicrobium mobile]
MLIRSRVPLRISFGGGGTDVSPYCEEYGGVVMNATIDRYATVSLFPFSDKTIEIESIDYDAALKYDVDQFLAYDGHLDLIKGVVNYMRKTYDVHHGFKLRIHNDAPPGSGLGSSSAVCVAVVGAFRHWLNLPMTPYEVAELAYYIERKELGIKGGKQDQYAAAFGGFNFIEFNSTKTIVNPLRLRNDVVCELNHRLVLAYVGGSHDSSKILGSQIKNMASGNEETLTSLHKAKELAIAMKAALLTDNLDDFGLLLGEAWESKKHFTAGITTPKIDVIYEKAKSAGALGGKISGAGGGGFMFFFTKPDKRYAVTKALQEEGIQIVNYSFTEIGLHTWEVRCP